MKEKVLAVLFTLMVIWAQGAILFQNGVFDSLGNLHFYDYGVFRDVTVHLSLVNELLNRFPPTNFAAGGIALKNYHYFFDALLSLFARIPGISLLDLYFRVTPVVLSIGLCAAIYFTTRQFIKKKIVAAYAIFFTVFATSFGPIVPFIKDFFHWNHVTGAGNTFMTDQIFTMMVNPQGILSLIIYLSIFLSLCWYEKTKKILALILVTFLLAISFGVKAYGGILFAPAAILASLYSRKYKLIFSVGLGVFMMGLWFLYSIDSKVAGLSFAPFWLLTAMMSDINRLNEPFFAYVTGWKLPFLVVGEFVLFLFGSLGINILGIFSIDRNLTASKVFLYVAAVFSLLMPLFFNQSSKAYEVVQFFPYFTLLMGIFFTISVFKLPKFFPIIFMIILLVLDKRELDRRFVKSNEEIIIPAPEISAVNFIRQNTDPAAIFKLTPSSFNADYLWFTALAGRRVVYAGSRFEQQIGVDEKNISKNFDYVFVSQTLDGGSVKISDQDNLKLVFQKDGAKVYKHD